MKYLIKGLPICEDFSYRHDSIIDLFGFCKVQPISLTITNKARRME